ncbi:MAG: lipoyl(octanoyl) transferase LipB [Betaproteobacteria bacterium]|nr:lipoyl(octanoyl) transferase LipB [Betaproteobacteria bacterium]
MFCAPLVRALGRQAYEPVWVAMREHCAARTADSPDELWWLEHEPVYTLGKAGRQEHLLRHVDTPVLRSDRGGQITWHGPGQVVVYSLLDLRRLGLTARGAVTLLENTVIAALAEVGVEGRARADAPGVYVDGAKVAALGLRVSRGCCYHGLSLNVDCDLAPFAAIDPCGHAGLAVTRTADLGCSDGVTAWASRVTDALSTRLTAQAGTDTPAPSQLASAA